jgi:hypothetical protein
MLRKIMLSGLMSATLLGGVAPAFAAQPDGDQGRRGDREARMQPGDGPRGRSEGQPAGGVWRGRDQGPARAPEAQVQVQAQPRPDGGRWQGGAPEGQDRTRGQDERRLRQADQPGPDRQPPRADGRPDWRNGQGDRPGWAQNRSDANRPDAGRPDVNRPVWQNRPDRDRADRNQQGWAQGRDEWRNRNDQRDWNRGREGWRDNGRRDGDRNDVRRYDDRTRWAQQRRWDNGWRQDRRYDWHSYRARYGDRFRVGRYYAPRGWNYGYRSFSIGVYLSSLLYANNYWIDDPYDYRLPPAYGTLRWVRYYDDALLVDIRDGYVVDVINNFFW